MALCWHIFSFIDSSPDVSYLDDDPLLDVTQTYYYYVTAVTSVGESLPSSPVSTTPVGIPTVPQNVDVDLGVSRVDLSWLVPLDDGGTPIVEYRLYRTTTSGSLYELVGVSPTTTYVDTDVTLDVTYYYVITAFNGVLESAYSSEISALASLTYVDEATGVTLTFGEGSESGTVEITTKEKPFTPPDGFRAVGVYYEITVDFTYVGPITISIPYDETKVTGPESGITLWHFSFFWDDVTTSVDTDNNIVYGQVDTLSFIVALEPRRPTPSIPFADLLFGAFLGSSSTLSIVVAVLLLQKRKA